MEHKPDKPSVKKEPSAWWLRLRAELPDKFRAFRKALPGRVGGWLRANFGMERARALRVLRDGVLTQNPVLVLSLGLGGVLLTTTDLRVAAALGGAAAAALLCTNLTVSLLRRRLPKRGRVFSLLAIVLLFTTLADVVLAAYLPDLRAQIGIFLPLLAVSGLFLPRAERFALKQTPGYAVLDALAAGLGYTLALALIACLREAPGSGTIAGVPVFGADFLPVLLLTSPAGGFLLLGVLTAAAQWLLHLTRKRKSKGGAKK